MAIGLVALVMLAMALFPDLPSTRALRMWLVERPMAWLSTARRHHVIFACIVLALLLMPETVLLLGAADLSIVAFALDVSLYIDAVIALVVLGVLFHVTAVWHSVVDLVSRPFRSRRALVGGSRSVSREDLAMPDGHIEGTSGS